MAIVDLPEGEHQYKFCVDGQWTLDPTGVSRSFKPRLVFPCSLVLSVLWSCFSNLLLVLRQPVITSKTGTVNNIIQVNQTDFEVFNALEMDSQDSTDLSGKRRQTDGLHINRKSD